MVEGSLAGWSCPLMISDYAACHQSLSPPHPHDLLEEDVVVHQPMQPGLAWHVSPPPPLIARGGRSRGMQLVRNGFKKYNHNFNLITPNLSRLAAQRPGEY